MKLIEELGKRRMLTVVKTVDFGIYLGTSEERVLLPKKEVPKEIEIGDPVEVFLYKDSSDRLIATTAEPKITLGELADSERYRKDWSISRLGTAERPATSIQRADC